MISSDNPRLAVRRDLKYVVLGAAGFVGGALVERLCRAGAQVVPVVRRVSCGSAFVARFGIPQALADVLDPQALEAVLAGVDVVFHCVTGDRAAIVEGLKNTLVAAQKGRVRRLVYLSSAVIHGFHPNSDVDESSPLDPPGWSEYAKNKAAAEKIIRDWHGGPETAVLRPSIIYGPRSRDWSEVPARQIAGGTAYLVDQGRGHMNEIHIAHLLDAMLLAAHHPQAANQVYTVRDGFGLNWHDYYHSLCELLGADAHALAAFTLQDVLSSASKLTRYRQWAKDTPGVLRSAIWQDPLKAWIKRAPGFEALRRFASAKPTVLQKEADGSRPAIVPELRIAMLHTYPQPIVDAKIRAELGFVPRLSFAEILEGLRRWYRFIGLVR